MTPKIRAFIKKHEPKYFIKWLIENIDSFSKADTDFVLDIMFDIENPNLPYIDKWGDHFPAHTQEIEKILKHLLNKNAEPLTLHILKRNWIRYCKETNQELDLYSFEIIKLKYFEYKYSQYKELVKGTEFGIKCKNYE